MFRLRGTTALFSLAVLVVPLFAHAATRTWDGGGTDAKWSTAANWSDNTVPTGLDIALFDGTGQKDATVDAGFAGVVGELRITAANTGTISVGRRLTVAQNLTLSGGTLALLGGNRLTVKGSWQNGGGTFTSNTGTVILAGSGTHYRLLESGTFKQLSLDDGLVGYWRFDEGSGEYAADSSSFGSGGTLRNGVTYEAAPSWGADFPNPYALSLDGVNDYVYFGVHPKAVGDRLYTISFWFKTTDTSGSVLHRGDSGNCAHNPSILFGEGAKENGCSNVNLLTHSAVSDGQWHHFVAMRNQSYFAIYIDGLLANSKTLATEVINSNVFSQAFDHFVVGARASGNGATPTVSSFYAGLVDDLRIYDRALSMSEILALNGGSPSTGSGVYTLGSALTVGGNMNIYSGTLDVSASNYALTASGSFSNHAGFVPRSGTVTLNGIGTTLRAFTSLYRLVIAASKSAVLRAAATVTNVLTVGTGATLTFNGHDITATNATLTNSGSLSQGTGGIIRPSGSLTATPSAGAVGDTISFTLSDVDANVEATTADTLTIQADGETITLTETGIGTALFSGTVTTKDGTRTEGNGVIERNDRCLVTIGAYYVDPQDATDSASASFTLTNNNPAGCGTGSATTSTSTSGGGSRARDGIFVSPLPSVSATPQIPPKPNIQPRSPVAAALERRMDVLKSRIMQTRNILRKEALQRVIRRLEKRLKQRSAP